MHLKQNPFHLTQWLLLGIFSKKYLRQISILVKDVHIIVLFAYLLSSYSKSEWAENAAVQTGTKKLSGKQIYSTTKWFLWKLDNLSHLYQQVKIWNDNGTFVLSILKVAYWVHYFIQISYTLVPKVQICVKYFLDKNLQQQPLWFYL